MVAAVAKLHDATISLEDNRPGVRVVVAFPKVLEIWPGYYRQSP
jgi:hypothetical protein